MDSDRTLNAVVDWVFGEDLAGAPAVEERARLLFLDTLGCMIAGLAKPGPRNLAASLGDLDGGAVTLPGAEVALSVGAADRVAGMAA